MIAADTSVVMKWFKARERHESESRDLRGRMERGEVKAAACEILSLEVVRGLKNAQNRRPDLGVTDVNIEDAFTCIEDMFRTKIVVECPVADVKALAKDVEVTLGLYMADALHLATALHLEADYLVVDDHHFLEPEVVDYAAARGVAIVDLPDLIAALGEAEAQEDQTG